MRHERVKLSAGWIAMDHRKGGWAVLMDPSSGQLIVKQDDESFEPLDALVKRDNQAYLWQSRHRYNPDGTLEWRHSLSPRGMQHLDSTDWNVVDKEDDRRFALYEQTVKLKALQEKIEAAYIAAEYNRGSEGVVWPRYGGERTSPVARWTRLDGRCACGRVALRYLTLQNYHSCCVACYRRELALDRQEACVKAVRKLLERAKGKLNDLQKETPDDVGRTARVPVGPHRGA